jgi:O-glycosyl hydrolase
MLLPRIVALTLFACTLSAFAGTARIEPDKTLVESFRGWGTSLCWWANVIGGLENHEEFSDAIFKDLKLTIVRYNIGGGENPKHSNLPSDPRARMQGFAPERDKWNPDADKNQRTILRDAIARGVTHVDAFSNSAPWFMTVTGTVTGGANPFSDNLKRESEKEFAEFLVKAMQHLTETDGVHFDTLSAMNEPLSPWWAGNRQEGCHMGAAQQVRVMDYLQTALADAEMKVGLVAPETFNAGEAIDAWKEFPETTRQMLRAVATHGYNITKGAELRAAVGNKPIWLSEYGDGDASGQKMARAIIDALNILRAEEWVFWQAVEPNNGWGLLINPVDGKSTQIERNPSFDVFRQFTNFIPPGSRIVATNDPNSIAALPPGGESLVIVALNESGKDEPFNADLSAAAKQPAKAQVTQTSPAARFAHQPEVAVKDGKLETTLPAKSVTTFVLSLK